jgi:hypothetical protein
MKGGQCPHYYAILNKQAPSNFLFRIFIASNVSLPFTEVNLTLNQCVYSILIQVFQDVQHPLKILGQWRFPGEFLAGAGVGDP